MISWPSRLIARCAALASSAVVEAAGRVVSEGPGTESHRSATEAGAEHYRSDRPLFARSNAPFRLLIGGHVISAVAQHGFRSSTATTKSTVEGPRGTGRDLTAMAVVNRKRVIRAGTANWSIDGLWAGCAQLPLASASLRPAGDLEVWVPILLPQHTATSHGSKLRFTQGRRVTSCRRPA